MQFVQFVAARADTGAALPFARATVYAAGTTTKADLFDADGNPQSNPAIADEGGDIGLAAADGLYDVQISSADGSYSVPLLRKVQIVDLMGVVGSIMSGRLGYASWAELATITAAAGQLAEVPMSDTGTHTDPVSGTSVNNSGVFRYTTGSPSGWKRIYDYDGGAISAISAAGATQVGNVNSAATAAEISLSDLLTQAQTAAANAANVYGGLGRDRYRRFYDELYSAGLYYPSANDDGTFMPTVASAGYWAIKASGDFAPGKTVSFYVRTITGTYVAAPTLRFYNSSGSQIGPTQTATSTDSDSAGRAIEGVLIPANTATLRAGHTPASLTDTYEAHLCGGPTTQHLRYVNINRAAIMEERPLSGVPREIRNVGHNAIIVNVPNGDARVYERLVKTRGGSLSTAERNAIYDAADMLKRTGLVSKLAAFYPLIGTGLGAMCTPLLDRFGYAKLVIVGSSAFAGGDWNPLNGLVATNPGSETLLLDTGIIPAEHGFGNNCYGIAIYALNDLSSSTSSVCVGATAPQTAYNATPTDPAYGLYPYFASAMIMNFGESTSQLNGSAAIKTASSSGAVTTNKTAGSIIGARREDGSALMTYNGLTANTGSYPGESTTPIVLTSIPTESIKISNFAVSLGSVAIINGAMEPSDHINLHYVMHGLNQSAGVRTSPPAIEGLI